MQKGTFYIAKEHLSHPYL